LAVISAFVMPGFLPGIHVFHRRSKLKDVDGRDKPGHDARMNVIHSTCGRPVYCTATR
jgi:hypothetical protein